MTDPWYGMFGVDEESAVAGSGPPVSDPGRPGHDAAPAGQGVADTDEHEPVTGRYGHSCNRPDSF